MSEMVEPTIGKASFLPAVLPHIFWFSISIGSLGIASSLDVDWLRNGMIWFGVVFGLLMAVVLVFDFVQQYDMHVIYCVRQDALIEQMKNPAQSVKSVVVAGLRIDFPPETFINFIFDERLQTMKFPTVDECDKKFGRGMAQRWYEQMERAGALVGRIPRMYAGDPSPEWTRERCVAAARVSNSLTALPGQRV